LPAAAQGAVPAEDAANRIVALDPRWALSFDTAPSAPAGFDQAVQTAIARAASTVRNLRWFEVVETRGQIEDGRIAHWQVTLKVGFTLE